MPKTRKKKSSTEEKEGVVSVQGNVLDCLPSAIFKVKLVDSEMTILCHPSGNMRKNFINIIVGDLVDIEMSPYDLTKGRIVYRWRD